MNEREKNKELIKRMSETLRNHAAPYKEGAWEQFSAKYGTSPKQGRVKWAYWAAAAVLLITAGIFLFDWQRPEKLEIAQSNATLQHADPITEINEPIGQTGTNDADVQDTRSGNNAAETRASVHVVGHENTQPSTKSPQLLAAASKPVEQDSINRPVTLHSGDLLAVATTHDSLFDNTNLLAAEGTKSDIPPSSDLIVTKEPQLFDEIPGNVFFEQKVTTDEYASVGAKASGTAKKWDLGLVIAPSLTSEKINMGGGVAVAYRLTDKLSLGSGVSISELGVAQQQQRGGRLMSQSDRQLDYNSGFLNSGSSQYKEITSVTSNVLAIDVPLDLKYNVTKGFYTSVGVSFLTILNEQRTNHFVGRMNQPTFGGNNAANQDLESSVRAVYSTERAAQQPLQGRGYTGFVNFSLGRTMPLSRKLQLSVEPYFKLPIGSLSKEEMDFTNGGIRIITGF